MKRLDYSKPVMVYRNLKHGRKTRPLYSVMQNGRVIRRTNKIMLADVRFVVRESGRQRVLQDGHKNVHAFAVGKVVGSGMGTDRYGRLPVTIVYNPYNDASFMACCSGEWTRELAKPVTRARCAILNEYGMTAAYTD